MADEEDFSQGDAGAADVVPVQASKLRKGHHCVMSKGGVQKACKIVDLSTSKTGKHGHAKINITALDIFDGSKYEDICPSTHNMLKPVVKVVQYQAMDIDEDNYVELMDDANESISVKCTDDKVLKAIQEFIDTDGSCMVTYTTALGCEKLSDPKQCKTGV